MQKIEYDFRKFYSKLFSLNVNWWTGMPQKVEIEWENRTGKVEKWEKKKERMNGNRIAETKTENSQFSRTF